MIFKLFFLIFLTCAPSLAQEQNEFSLEQIKKDFLAPVTTDAKYVLLYGGSLSLLLSTVYRDTLVQDTQDNFQEHKHLREYSDYGDVLGKMVPNAIYAGGHWAMWHWGGNKKSYDRSLLMLKASIYSGGTTLVLKHAISERRPNGDNNLSFPSGHTTTAFAFASVVAAEHSWYWGIASYSMATFVGLSRINDNAHYLHDVIAGATIGTAFGLGLYYAKNPADNNLAIIPTANGIQFAYNF